jgi:prepilin peptidase CpaA
MNTDLNTFAAVLAFTTIAVWIDVRTRRIPKWLTITCALLGLAYHATSAGLPGLAVSLGGFATGFGVLLVLWLSGAGGGGDVKMMGAVGAWLGAFTTLLVFIGSGLFAVICTLGMLAWNRRRTAVVNGESLMRITIPYAVPVSMAIWTLLAFHLLVP